MTPEQPSSSQATVLLPVFNGERFLAQAIQSVLDQTFEDFELLAIDDGSTDKSLSILRDYAERDSRIHIVTRPNKGLVATLNEGLDLARGKYIARLDSDDVCERTRLQKQVIFLDDHPDYAICACRAHIIDQYGRKTGEWPNLGCTAEQVKMSMRFSSAFPHSSVCFNADIVRTQRFYYRQEYHPAEDFELFNRVLNTHLVYVIEEPLLMWRSHPLSISYQKRTAQLSKTIQVLGEHLTQMGHTISLDWLNDFLSRDSGISIADCNELSELLLAISHNIDNEPSATRDTSRKSFAILVSRLAIEIGCVRGFRVTNEVFKQRELKRLFSKRAKLLFILARSLPASSVTFLDKVVFYVYLKISYLISWFYWNLKKPMTRPPADEK